MEILRLWNEFRAMPYADEALIGLGALLLFFGVIRILKSSFTMLFWLILSGVGLVSMAQGLHMSPLKLASDQRDNVTQYLEQGKELSADALAVLCRKLEENQLLDAPQNEH